VVFFQPELVRDFEFRRKRGGHLFSKMRFLSVQLQAYLEQDLWRHNAERANRLASRLAKGLAEIPGVSLAYPVQANELFVQMPEPLLEDLTAAGFTFYRWAGVDLPLVRLVTSFDTTEAAVDQFLAVCHRAAVPVM